MPSKPAHASRKRPRPTEVVADPGTIKGDSCAVLLERVRAKVRAWNDKLAKKKQATGEDAHRLLYDVSEAAWPKVK